jgi:hypothetical protein
MNHLFRFAISGLLCVILSAECILVAQQKKYYFYKPAQTRGSDASFTPLALLVNGSFDALRLSPDAGRDLTALKWKTDFDNVWKSLRNPLGSVRAYGWENFRRQELLNLSFNVDDLQFIPNLADHVIGYGMQYAKVTEWYEAHGYDSPVLLGVGTSLVYQLVNEVVQNSGTSNVNVDCVADVYIFNMLGFALFSFEEVKEFFSETIQLNDWSLQPLYVPRNHHLENAGQQFVMRYTLPFAERYAPFICWGVNSVAGLSYRYDDVNRFSVGVGNAITGMTTKYRGEFISATPDFEKAVGLFWDNDGSLLAGLIVSGRTTYNAQLNVYPGLIDICGIRPGCYLGAGGREGVVFGVTFSGLPISIGIER